jgi:DNA-binding transcriptional MerR regulator
MSTAAKKRRSKSQSDEVLIPDKIYFRIGEVSKLSKLPAYVLRFWETEFPQLKPNKGSTGQRMYRRRDVENVLIIKKLLYDEGYTIAGAREKLKADARPAKGQPILPFPKKRPAEDLKRIRQGLQEILHLLNNKKR